MGPNLIGLLQESLEELRIKKATKHIKMLSPVLGKQKVWYKR